MEAMHRNNRIVITPGEPAGVGPDLVAALAQQDWPVELVVCADPALLLERARQLALPLTLRDYQPSQPAQPQRAGTLTVLPVAAPAAVVAGELNVANSAYVVATLARACDGCLNGEFAALVTGPVNKSIINDAGVAFTGHTEFFADPSPRAAASPEGVRARGARVPAQWEAGGWASVPRDARQSPPGDEGAAACVGAARGRRSLPGLCVGFIEVVKRL